MIRLLCLLAFLLICGAGHDAPAVAADMAYKDLVEMSTPDVQRLADAGDNHAKLEMSVRYATGNGVAKDPQRAIEIARDSAAQGNSQAMYLLGVAYTNGVGVEKSDPEAVHWFERSAKLHNRDGEHWYGFMIATGRAGGPPNWKKGAPWLERAAADGNSLSALVIGTHYDLGDVVKKNPEKAAQWYRRAIAIDGNVQATMNLGALIQKKLVIAKPGEVAVPEVGVEMKRKGAGQ